jgi:hypothetical protein
MSKNKHRLFSTNQVDDDLFMCADLHIKKTFKDGLEFEFERQSGFKTKFTLYRGGVEELNEFLNKWLKENA